MRVIFILFFFTLLISCTEKDQNKTIVSEKTQETVPIITETSLVILGTIQDAGSPQIGCTKDCCKDLFAYPDKDRKVVCLGIVDPLNKKKYILEATPDFVTQTKALKNYCRFETIETPDAIFLTHAHIGHYTGLMYLGKEAMSAHSIPVYVMPRMKTFLENNGPWSQLVMNKNIQLKGLQNDSIVQLSGQLSIVPFLVPHRDEYSETVGYKIIGPNKSALFVPDIDKWEKWDRNIIEEIKQVDYAFMDATFFDGEEINNRDISEIPHPFIIESMEGFKNLPASEKSKIYFIHFNHTNPVISDTNKAAKRIIANGFNIAHINDIIKL